MKTKITQTTIYRSLGAFQRSLLMWVLLCISSTTFAQLCGTGNCGGTVPFSNFGFNSSGPASTIEYDNFVSAFHTTVVRTSDGAFKIWGESSQADGVGHHYTPQEITPANGYSYIGAPLKATIGSNNMEQGITNIGVQQILLTTDGLYAWGRPGIVLSTSIKNTFAFAKVTGITGANTYGLPAAVTPANVKMLTASLNTLALLTCDGQAWVLTTVSNNAGVGAGASDTEWHRVTTNEPGNPVLNDVVVLRASPLTLVALTGSGDLWTWGRVFDGGTVSYADRDRAIPMILPKASGSIKMVGVTRFAYAVLYEDGDLFMLGENATNRQLGDWTDVSRRNVWVQPLYPDVANPAVAGLPMKDIQWVSANEHDGAGNGAINVINKNGVAYNWGSNSAYMLGRSLSGTNVRPGIPGGLTAADKILVIVTGGHTTMAIKQNEPKMGYVGHYVNGSPGNGFTGGATIEIFQWVDTEIDVCGVLQPFVQDVKGCEAFINLAPAITNTTRPDAVVRWFDGDNPATATQIADPSAVWAGVYYAFYYYPATNTYSPPSAPVTATAYTAADSEFGSCPAVPCRMDPTPPVIN